MTNISETQFHMKTHLTIFAFLRRTMGGMYQRAADRYAQRQADKMNRDAFQHVLSVDDHMLDDMGVTRGQVQHAANLPLGRNAALELQRNKALTNGLA